MYNVNKMISLTDSEVRTLINGMEIQDGRGKSTMVKDNVTIEVTANFDEEGYFTRGGGYGEDYESVWVSTHFENPHDIEVYAHDDNYEYDVTDETLNSIDWEMTIKGRWE